MDNMPIAKPDPSPEHRSDRRAPLATASAIALLLLLAVAFYAQTALTNLILPGADATTYFYPYRAYAAESVCRGRIPLWNPYLFLGVPFLANPQAAVFYPLNVALCWLSAPKIVAWSSVLHVALAAITSFLYARHTLRLSRLPALLSASAFAFGGFLSGQAEHVNQLNVSAWFPLLLLLGDLGERARAHGRRRAERRILLALGVVLGLGLLAGHAQSSYISAFGLGVYAALPLARDAASRLRPTDRTSRASGHSATSWIEALWAVSWRLGLIAVIAVALASVQLLPTLELARLSIRSGGLSYREAVAFSLKPVPRLLRYTFLPPMGRDLSVVFGGSYFTEYLAYVGVVPLLLAAFAVGLRLLRFAGAGSLELHRAASRHAYARLLALGALGVFLALGLYNPLYLALFELVPGFDLFRVPARWLLLYAFSVAMWSGIGLQELIAHVYPLSNRRPAAEVSGDKSPSLPQSPHVTRAPRALVRTVPPVLVLAALAELFYAAQALPLNRATAPGAFFSLRSAPAHLLVAQGQGTAPGRVLSLSQTLFDPGDLDEIRQILAHQLTPEAIYDYVVGIKRQEILAPNLPLAWQIYAVDGYDGGVLPLARYVTLQRLFLAPEAILTDGRLREGLDHVPPSRLLSLLGVRYVITDKVNDVWIDNVFYDLAFDAILGANAATFVSGEDIPAFVATEVGIVSHLEGARQVRDGAPVADVRIETTSGDTLTYVLRAGIETAEGHYTEDIAHSRASRALPGLYRSPPGVTAVPPGTREPPTERNEYVARLDLGKPAQIARIEIAARPFYGLVIVRGVTLIDSRDGSNVPLLISTQGRFRLVHSGDVKVYRVLDALPRAYAVHHSLIVPDDEAALTEMKRPGPDGRPVFDPAQTVLLARGRALSPPASNQAPNSRSNVTVSLYRPEQVVLHASMAAPGYVVLSDSWYPGWKATVDGRPTTVERANLNFRAVYLPAGDHTVRMVYRPPSFFVGVGLSALAWASAVLWLILGTRHDSQRSQPARAPVHR